MAILETDTPVNKAHPVTTALKQELVTVILPIRNEEKFIRGCLQSIVNQDYPPDRYEVLIVDGMSEDCTRDIVTESTSRYSNFKLIDNHKRIVPSALNMGITHSKGEIIIRVDGHTFLEPDYISQCVRYLSGRKEIDNVGGLMRPVGESFIGKAIAIAHCSRFGLGGGKFHYAAKEQYVDTVYMGAYRKELFGRIGPLNENLACGEEIEINYRIRQNGGKVLLTPAIKSHYHNRTSLVALWRQFFRNALWNVKIIQESPGALSIRHFIPPLFVSALVCTAFLSLFSRIGIYLLLTLIVSYSTLSTAFSIGSAIRNGYRFFVILPVVFICLHMSYGIGYFAGILRFVKPFKF